MKPVLRSLSTAALAFFLSVLGIGSLHAYDPAVDPTFVIKTNPIVLAAGASSEVALVEGSNLRPVPNGTRLQIRDLGQGSSEIKIAFTRPEDAFSATDGARYWWVTLEAEGLPAESELNRAAGLTFGDNAGVADYVVSTRSAETLIWTLTPPKKRLRIQQTREITFPVRTGARKVTLALAGSSLQDPTTIAWLDDARLGLRLASAERQDGAPRNVSVELPANATTNVMLEIDGEPEPGSYSGSVSLAAHGNPETQSFELEVLSSPSRRRWLGAGLIFLGIALSFFVTVVARSWAKRLQSLRAAALIAAGLEPLGPKLEAARTATGHPLERLGQALSTLLDEFGARRLAAGSYLPPLVPVSVAGDDERTEALKNHLKTLADQAKVLDEIVRGGVEEVVERFDEGARAPYAGALDKLEKLPESATTQTVAGDVAKVLAELPEQVRAEVTEGRPARPGPRELQVRLDYLHGSIWFIWAAVTLAAGIGVLILTNQGFGTATDLLTCFFWGLGVQTAGDGLQQLTPGSVKSTLQISAPPTDS